MVATAGPVVPSRPNVSRGFQRGGWDALNVAILLMDEIRLTS